MRPLLSIVIPAFNESLRLPAFLTTVREYVDRDNINCQIIVVDDGSSDGSEKAVCENFNSWRDLIVIKHPFNRGKGAAVKTGVLAADGEIIMFCDADGATPISQEKKLRNAILSVDIAVGSRRTGDAKNVNRHWFRGIVGRVFSRWVQIVLSIPIQDTQCGFKMFRRAAARELFKGLHEERFSFDVEILAAAAQKGYSMTEIGVEWNEQKGGKTSVFLHGPQMLSSVLKTRRRLYSTKANRPITFEEVS